MTEFYLAPGGPIDRLHMKLKLRRADSEQLGRRALIIALVLWLPLLMFAILQPVAGAEISFFKDIAAHVRFLLIVPLLIVAEGAIGARSRLVVSQFLSSGLVADSDAGRFEEAIKRGRRLLDSALAEFFIVVLAASVVWFGIRMILDEPAVFWFERVTAQGSTLTLAGWWYAAVASPIVAFLLVRWFWRYLVWWWFLGRVARLDLRLTGTHPDRVGGLGFVGFHHAMFAVLTFAVGCAVSAAAANRILYADVSLLSYRTPLIAIVLAAVLIGVAPMLAFTGKLIRTKHRAWMTYSRFASDYVWLFEQKWLGRKTPPEDVLGASDIQSLADLGGSFERLVTMRPVVIDRRLVLAFFFAAAAPALPLLLTVMPFQDIVRTLLKAVI